MFYVHDMCSKYSITYKNLKLYNFNMNSLKINNHTTQYVQYTNVENADASSSY